MFDAVSAIVNSIFENKIAWIFVMCVQLELIASLSALYYKLMELVWLAEHDEQPIRVFYSFGRDRWLRK